MKSLKYASLRANEFRLLYLRIGDDGDVVGKLRHRTRDHRAEYDALSYAWNSDDDVDPVSFVCDGYKLMLPCPASTLGGRDQDDSADKSSQVPLMREYYSKARQVVVWLGPSGEATDHAMDSVESLNILLGRSSDSSLVPPGYLAMQYLPREGDRVWSGLQEIFYRRWFTRVWVVQEVALGSDIVVMCGSKSINWDQLSRLTANLKRAGVVNIVRRVRERDMTIWDGIASMGTFDRHRAARKEEKFCKLTTLCMDSRWRRTSNPLDKVYGLLGLMNDETRQQIAVDYSEESKRDFWKVYRAMTILLLKKSSALGALRIAATSARIPEAPSWCMNLNSPERPLMFSRSTYSAGRPAKPRDNSHANARLCSISPDQSRLTLRGYKVDEVSDIVLDEWPDPLLEPKRGENGADAKILKWMDDCGILAEAAYVDKSNILEDLGRTLIANLLEDPLKYAPDTQELKGAAMHALNSLRLSAEQGKDFSEHFPRDVTARALRYRKAMHIACNGRKFFTTKDGRLGLGSGDVEVGDQIYLFKGAEVLFLFRRQPDEDASTLVGDAYVHGLMNGEAIKDAEEAGHLPVDLTVV